VQIKDYRKMINVQFGYLKSLEPQIIEKKEEVTLKNATSLQIGDPNGWLQKKVP
jgi:hypothetical protein